MKYLRQFCTAIVLILAISLSAFAGDIHLPGVQSSSSQPSASGNMDFPGATTPSDPLTVVALGLLQNALSLF